MTTVSTQKDDRQIMSGRFARILRRPEVGAAVAALLIFTYFSSTTTAFLSTAGVSTWLYSSSLFGVLAVAGALLMIGGEFDLSVGAMTGTTGLIVGIMTTEYGTNIWLSIILALIFALSIGAANAYISMKTGVPSFIVTLAALFILQGANLAITKLLTGTVAIQGMSDVAGYESAKAIFGSTINIGGMDIKISIVWWLAITVVASWVLLRTRTGNWIFGVGGAFTSARQVGIPVVKVRMGLFMATSAAGWLVGMLQLFGVSTVQATTGLGQEFSYVICAVVGGCLLTGGYGSAIGAAVGALIYGMTLQGIVFAQWDNNWLKFFLGVLLLLAVLVNLYVRRRAGDRS
jgi:simple sugar transport system permease protein